jgi:hypothetical protein
MNNAGYPIHPGHQRLREIIVDTEKRRAFVCELCKLADFVFLSPEVVQSLLDHKQHFLASTETCASIVEFIRQI